MTICHPPVDNKARAYHNSDVILPEKTHFARNRDIVKASNIVIVVPAQMSRQDRGGTWYTYDYAVKCKTPWVLIYPDGSVVQSSDIC